MLDLAERAAVQSILDHLSHEYTTPDIAYVIRRLRFMLDGSRGEMLPPGCIVRFANVFVAGRSTITFGDCQ